MNTKDYQEPLAYGFNKIIKAYTGFPWYLPLPAQLEHGWTNRNHPLPTDLKSAKPLMLVFSARRKFEWKKKSETPVEVMGAPFLHYRRYKNISIDSSAKGTVVFPAHSTYDLKAEYDVKKLCQELKKLPSIFHPITICLFYIDFISPSADIYCQNGFRVKTAGGRLAGSCQFANNLYDILSSHRYAASNEVSSVAFYAVDLGLPFFLIGHRAKYNITRCKDLNIAYCLPGVDAKTGKLATKIFSSGPTTKISPKQRKFVREEMGVDDCLSKDDLRNILLKFSKRKFSIVIVYLVWSFLKLLILDAPWTSFLVKIKYKISAK